MKRDLTLRKILFSLVGFIFLWTVVTDAWGYSDSLFDFSNGNYIYSYISRFVWVLPAGLIIIRYNNFLPFSKKQLFSYPKLNKSLSITFIVSLVYAVASMIIKHNGFWINKEEYFLLVILKFFIVGFVEETVFRGWGYNALTTVISDRKAVFLSTAFFVLLHWPAYFIRFCRFGILDFSGLILQSLTALIWGILFCWLMKKGQNLWNSIIAHTAYDILLVLLIG